VKRDEKEECDFYQMINVLSGNSITENNVAWETYLNNYNRSNEKNISNCTGSQESLFFTGATTQGGSWPSPWFCNGKFFCDIVVIPTTNLQPGVPGTKLRLAPTL
jgi:hypothetical protein